MKIIITIKNILVSKLESIIRTVNSNIATIYELLRIPQ